MALIICPECGKQISDKAECCIGCGFPLKYLAQQEVQKTEEVQEDTRTELEKLVDEIFERNKKNRTNSAEELRRRTGMTFRQAMDLIQKKYLADKAEEKLKRQQRQKKGRSSYVHGEKITICPKCLSASIHYHENGKGERCVVCLGCGYEWNL